MSATYYTILGISPTATAQEVKAAYKRLALKYHPDRNPGNAHAEELFKLVNTANQTLSDPGKRALYDMRLQYQREQQRRAIYHQAHYEQSQQYYGTRQPAGVSERYYKPRQVRHNRFSRKDWYITAAFVGGILLFSLLLKTVMDHVSGEDKYKTALTYMADGKYSSAHTLLSDAIQFIPDHAGAYEARASINLEVNENYEQALRDLNQSIALQEKPPAHLFYMRGRSYKNLEKYGQAEHDLTTALRLNPTLWLAYLKRGEVRLFYLQKQEAAISDLTEYLNRSSAGKLRVEALTYRGFGYYRLGQSKKSEQDYRAALAEDKDNGRLYYLLGRTEMELQQQPDSACAHFSQAYQLGYSAALKELRANCQ